MLLELPVYQLCLASAGVVDLVVMVLSGTVTLFTIMEGCKKILPVRQSHQMYPNKYNSISVFVVHCG